ncbi:T9SS type B sorting domain-containing protein [Chitinophaga agrisoli]|uniref:T9SS type B sorting domain-containing protein n=1 Tax=Chitinophaga agrisoli TaxID=2607653 RepID=A0A5B2W1K5_9BACT|nr:gliding motility-associated C-terminal domain-containing protein [Chitinophaga agrisoli]KAA2244788.1 T9SS type B sorting domain-containing protein [Chitinophaga agrisoli]
MHLKATLRSSLRAVIPAVIYFVGLLALPQAAVMATAPVAKTATATGLQPWQQDYQKEHPYAPFTKTLPLMGIGGAPGPLWTFATTQSPQINGLLCVGCFIETAPLAADGDTTTSSRLVLTLGLASSMGQRLNFPGDYLAGDYVAIDLEVPNQALSAELLGGINIVSYNNGTSNNDATFLNGALVNTQLLGLGTGNTPKFRAVVQMQHNFNAIQINISAALAALGSLRVYEAAAVVPVIANPDTTVIVSGQTASLGASLRLPNATFKWYTQPSGGTAVLTGANVTTPPISDVTTYYIEATTPDNLSSYVRTPVTVRVSGAPGPIWSYGDDQISPRTGGLACALCSVNNPGLAVDGDTTTASGFSLPIGVLGSVGQLVKFPGEYYPGDSIVLFMETADNLLTGQLLPGITVETYHNAILGPAIENNDEVRLDASVVRLELLGLNVGNNRKFKVTIPVTDTFDAVQINLAPAVSLSLAEPLKLYEAVAMVPVTVNPSPATVNYGKQATLTPDIRIPGATFNWYTSPTGGAPFANGVLTTPPLTRNATYYVEGVDPSGKTSFQRTAVQVTVAGGTGPLWTYGIEQQGPRFGGVACALCSVNDAALAADGDTTTCSLLSMPLGVASSVGQYIRFPAEYQPGDSVVLFMATSANLLANTSLLSGIRVQTFLGNAPNNDAVTLDNSLINLQLLGTSDGLNHFRISFPASHTFDGTQVDLISVVGLADGLYLCEATAMMPVQVTRITPASDTVDAGQTARFGASIPRIPDATFSWYETPTGGAPVFTGNEFTTPPLIGNKTYYVEAFSPGDGLHSLIRTAVPIIVRPLNTLTCGAATTQSSGTSGVACLGCAVLNGPNAVDSDVNTASEMRVGIGLLGGVFQGIGFPALSGAADSLRIGVGATTGLLDAGLLAGLTFTLYNGATQVQEYNNAALLDLRLLDDSIHSELVFAPGVAFDSVHIGYNALLAAISSFNIFYAKVTPPNAGVQDSLVRACPGGGVTLTATTPAGATFRWFKEYSGGTALQTGASFSPGNITTDTVFYVEAVSTGVNGCGSNTRTPVFVKLGLPAVVVDPTHITIDRGQTATFNVVDPNAAYAYRWFRVDSGGTAVDTGAQFITPALDTNTVYYVQADSSTCSSRRTPVYVTISTRPLPPVIIPDTAFVSPGQSATFRIANPDPALSYRWYNVDSGGTILATDTMYITPGITANGRVYAEAVDASGQASRRDSALAMLVNGPNGPLPCTYANAQESPVYAGPLNICLLCGVTEPGSAIDADLNTSTKIRSNIGIGYIGQMLHFQQPGVAGDSLRFILGLPTGLADAQLLGGVRVQAYNSGNPVGNPVFLNGGGLANLALINGNKFQATIPVTATYDAVLVSLGGVLTALSTLEVYNAEQIILPAKPDADSDSLIVCLGSSARIVARDTAGIIVKWYASTNATTALFTGGIFNTPALDQASTTYYIESGRNGCANPQRVPVTVKAVAAPATPQLTAASVTVCVGNTATLSVLNPQVGSIYKWYDAPTGGNLVDSGAVLSIIPPSTGVDTVMYYVAASVGSCSSSSRGAGTVYVGTRCGVGPGADTTTLTLCAGASTTLTVDSVEAGATYRWYNLANDSLVATGNSYTTPALNANASYRLTGAFPGNILDTLRIYEITVASSLAVPTLVAPEIVTTTGSSATFMVANPQGNVMYRWYTAPTGGTPVDTGTSFTTPPLNGDSAKYYVEAITGSCSSPARAVATVRLSDGDGGVPCYAANTTQSPVYTAPISICLLCGVTDANNAVDGDTTTSSKVRSNIGIGYIGQVLNFQQPGKAGDSIRLVLALPGGLADAQLLGGIRVQTYNNGSPAGNPVFLNGGLGLLNLELLSGNKFIATIAAPADYNAVYVSIGGVLTALTTLEVFAAEQHVVPAKPSADTDSLTVCLGSSARLVARDTAGITVKWYATATGGTALFTGGIFNTPPIVQSPTIFYIESSRNGCANPVRIPVTVTGTTCNGNVDTTRITICRGTSTTLSANINEVGFAPHYWYNLADNSLVASAPSYATPVLNSNAAYRLEGTVGAGLRDTLRIFIITVVDPPVVPVLASNAVISCGGPATLSVLNPLPGVTYNWYNTATGGTIINTGATFTVTPPTGADSARYYVEATVGSCASSSRGSGVVRVISNLQPPTFTINDQSTSLGGTVTFTVANPQAGITYTWYNTPTGGTPLAIGTSFTTPPLAGDSAKYYVEASAGPCTSPTRAVVTVRNNGNGGNEGDTTVITICAGSDIMLNAVNPVNGVTYRWYNAANNSLVFTGTSFTTPVLNANVTYKVEATLPGGAKNINQVFQVIVSNNTTPPTVVASIVKVCNGQDATLIVQNPLPGYTYQWFDAATGGSLVFTGPVFTVASVNGNRDYYVQSVLNNKCASATRTKVSIQAGNTPAAPTVVSNNVITCIGSTATFNIQNPDPAVTYRWYNQPNGGSLLAIGTAYTTAGLTATTTFYVEAAFNAGCVSTARTGVTATVVSTIDAPLANGAVICSGQSAVLTVRNPVTGMLYRWYSTSAGGTPLFTGASYTTPARTSNATYYVDAASSGGCISISRTPVNVTVNPVPDVPAVASATVSICPGQTATLQVLNPNAALTYRWYDTPAGGTAVTTGATLNTGPLTANQQYYVEAVNGNSCASNQRTAVSVTVGAPDANDIAVDIPDPECPGTTVTLTASAPSVPGASFRWYNAATGGTLLTTGSSYTTPPLDNTTTYYVEVFTDGGCASTSRKAATITVLEQLATPVVTISDSSATSVTFRWSPITGATRYEVSTNNGASFAPPSSGANGTTHTVGGLSPNQPVTLQVRAVNTNVCQTSELSAGVTGKTSNPAGDQVFVPNLFSPNGDGANDVLKVYGNTIASMELHIYNGWGQQVFQSKDQQQGWDGTMNGRQQPAGVYVYIVKATLQNGAVVTKKGNVTIIR